MNSKSLIWACAVGGMIAGTYVPLIWGGKALSYEGLLCSGACGLFGVWLGYKLGESI